MTESINHQDRGEPLFALGQLVATPGALALLDELNLNLFDFVRRHQSLDSDVCAEDDQANRAAVMVGNRIVSSFHLLTECHEEVLLLITESDRSSTCALLGREY